MPRSFNKVAGILLLLVLICVGTTLLTPAFVKPFNVQNILRYSALYGIIGIGVALVIITGGIDLSIGSVIGLVGCLLPLFLVEWGWSVPVSLLAVMLVSLVIGLAHGLLVTTMRLQPFIVTLCGLLIYRGLARWITADQTMGFGSEYDHSLRLLAIGKPCSIAFLILVGGIGQTLLCAWRWWGASAGRSPAPSAEPQAAEPKAAHQTAARGVATVGILLGLMLTAIGGSRFVHGYRIDRGGTLFALGSWEIPSWSTTVAPRGAEYPQKMMTLAGFAAMPGVLWLLFALAAGRNLRAGESLPPVISLLTPLVLMALAALLVWEASEFADAHSTDAAIAKSSLVKQLPGGAAWAGTWRISGVFISLTLLMASLAWFGRQALRIAGVRAAGPLLLTSSAAILWLLGQTPLGETLVPAPLLVLLALAAIASVFLNQTIYGRYLLALGNNEEAARFSGIQTGRMILLAYVLCSLAAGLGGILFALDTNTIQPQSHGNFYELYAIAAAVLGGCSLRGGEGTIVGVVIGAAVMRVLYNSINLIGIPSQLEFAIIGTVILLGVLADEIVKRVFTRGRGSGGPSEATIEPKTF